MNEQGPYSSTVDAETRRRIQIALWAYAYELDADPLVSDAVFDETAAAIDPSITTRRPDLDQFFRTKFQPHTGQWIWQHPELHIIGLIVREIREGREHG